MPGLIVALDNDKAAYWACLILRDIGPAAKDAVPALTKKLEDKDPQIRREAILALASTGSEAEPVVPAIAAALKDEQTCGAATYALGRIGQIPANVEPTIKANAKSSDKVLSTASLWALARVHPDDKDLRREVAEQLIPRMKDSRPDGAADGCASPLVPAAGARDYRADLGQGLPRRRRRDDRPGSPHRCRARRTCRAAADRCLEEREGPRLCDLRAGGDGGNGRAGHGCPGGPGR